MRTESRGSAGTSELAEEEALLVLLVWHPYELPKGSAGGPSIGAVAHNGEAGCRSLKKNRDLAGCTEWEGFGRRLRW